MIAEECPFYGAAIGRRYSFFSHSPGHGVCFVKDGLFLDVRTDYRGETTGKLSFVVKAVVVSFGGFSLPNRNFDSFEKRMIGMKAVLNNWVVEEEPVVEELPF